MVMRTSLLVLIRSGPVDSDSPIQARPTDAVGWPFGNIGMGLGPTWTKTPGAWQHDASAAQP
jgi:hypothetical protein